MKKRILSLALALTLILALIPAAAANAGDHFASDGTWSVHIREDGIAYVTGNEGVYHFDYLGQVSNATSVRTYKREGPEEGTEWEYLVIYADAPATVTLTAPAGSGLFIPFVFMQRLDSQAAGVTGWEEGIENRDDLWSESSGIGNSGDTITLQAGVYRTPCALGFIGIVVGGSPPAPPPPPEPVPPLFDDLANVSIEGLTNIEYVYEKGLMSGSGGNFMPFNYARNAQFLAILSRLAGAGVTDGAVWFQPYVDWAKEFGIIEAGEFNADADMAREDMALWMYRYITISGIELPSVNGKPDYQDIAGLSEEHRIAAEALFDWNIIRGSTPGEVFGAGASGERVALANVLARFVRMLP
jgi:hypothetical protein